MDFRSDTSEMTNVRLLSKHISRHPSSGLLCRGMDATY